MLFKNSILNHTKVYIKPKSENNYENCKRKFTCPHLTIIHFL